MSEFIKVSKAGPICEIGFARAEKRNAITEAMYTALAQALLTASTDETIAAAILYAEGDAFTAGNDLKDFMAAAARGPQPGMGPVGRFLEGLVRFDKPLIAAVQGAAVGIGTTLLLHCDLVFAEADAKFSTPFAALGLTPEAASSQTMPQRMGYARAYAMLALGEVLSAEAALAAGLVNEVLGKGEALPRARKAANELAMRPRQALAITKRLMRGNQDAIWDLMLAEGREFFAQTQSAEAQAAFMAFFQKRSAS